MIWEPKKPNNPFGHAAIQTNTYHMSLWPDGDCKEDFGYAQTLVAGVDGSLVFHHQWDYQLEGKREPLQYNIDYCSMKEVEELYEEMLDFNDITHDKVTLDSGNEIITQNKTPEISLKKSAYSFEGKYLKPKSLINYYEFEPIRDFYKHKQSCTTFCMNLLLNSGAFDPKSHFIDLISSADGNGIFRVQHFKTIIEKKFKFGDSNCIIS